MSKHTLVASALVAALALAAPRADATGCGSPTECASEFCVSGVCCDTKCDGVCDACSAAAKGSGVDGTCGPVAAGSVTCRAATCVDGVETPAAKCDGTDACPAAESKPCGRYACDGSRCRTTCRSTLDCAAGSACDDIDKTCVDANTCDGDHTIVSRTGEKKDCAPFKCDKTKCLENCTTTSQCTAGYVCNGSLCVQTTEPPPADDDGGCATSPGRRSASALLGAMLGLGLLARAARRRP